LRLARYAKEFNILYTEALARGARGPDGFDTRTLETVAKEAKYAPILEALGIVRVTASEPPCSKAVLFEVYRAGVAKGYAYVPGRSCEAASRPGCPDFTDPVEVSFGPPIRGVGLCLYRERVEENLHG